MPDYRRTHVLVTHEGDAGWSAESPQEPGFTLRRSTLSALRADLPDALRLAGVATDVLQLHSARRCQTADGDDYTIRVAEDRFRGEDRIGRLVEQLHPYKDLVTVVGSVGDEAVASVQFATDPPHPDFDWTPIEDLGWTADTTFGELIQDRPAASSHLLVSTADVLNDR